MKTYPIVVSGSRMEDKAIKRVLTKAGLAWDGIEYSGQVTERRLKKLQRFAEAQDPKLTLRITNALGRRRADYRRRYFSNHPPDVGKRYICVYCGRWMKRDAVTVDHLYPVGRVSRDVKLQKKLERRGIRNINDPQNLVAACQPCNAGKANSMGFWILRGRIGRHPGLWFARYLLRMAVIAAGVWSVYYIITLL